MEQLNHTDDGLLPEDPRSVCVVTITHRRRRNVGHSYAVKELAVLYWSRTT